jgi:hypothetical protein
MFPFFHYETVVGAFFKSAIAALETSISLNEIVKDAYQLQRELQGSVDDMRTFSNLASSPKGSLERSLYEGTHVEPSDYLVFMVQGFSPSIQTLTRVAEDKVFAPTRKLVENTTWKPFVDTGIDLFQSIEKNWMEFAEHLSFIRSNDVLIPFGKWLGRWGNEVRVGLDRDNTLQTDDLFDLINYVKEQHEENPDKKIVLFGISAGGMYSMLAADYLYEEFGVLVDHVVTAGSPEISPETNEAFLNMTKEAGLGGLVHLASQEYMKNDLRRGKNPKYSLLQELMIRYGEKGGNPAVKIRRYNAPGDTIVPDTFSTGAIEIPGHHATLYYRPEFIADFSKTLSTPRGAWEVFLQKENWKELLKTAA